MKKTSKQLLKSMSYFVKLAKNLGNAQMTINKWITPSDIFCSQTVQAMPPWWNTKKRLLRKENVCLSELKKKKEKKEES